MILTWGYQMSKPQSPRWRNPHSLPRLEWNGSRSRRQSRQWMLKVTWSFKMSRFGRRSKITSLQEKQLPPKALLPNNLLVRSRLLLRPSQPRKVVPRLNNLLVPSLKLSELRQTDMWWWCTEDSFEILSIIWLENISGLTKSKLVCFDWPIEWVTTLTCN